jgi:chromosome segregation ATPase
MTTQNLNPKSVKEIVDFINQTSCQTDMNLFERLNSDELLNIYINCLIFLGAANDYNDFELNENEENLFATVVKENKALKVIKVSALINNLLKKFGHNPNFSPVNIFNPNINITFSTLMKLLDAKKKIEEYQKQYWTMINDYQYTLNSHVNINDLLKESHTKKNDLIKTLEEGNKLTLEIKNNIENYSKQIDELNPLINANKENLVKLKEDFFKKNNQKEILNKKIEENESILEKLKERIVPNPETFNKIKEQNQQTLINYNNEQSQLQKELDNLYKNNETCMKVNEKLINLKNNVEEYHEYDLKNKELFNKKEQINFEIKNLEKEMIECKSKYGKNVEVLKNTELMLKNQQKEFNNMKSKLNTQIKENEKIKNDLKITLDHITNEILKYKSEIDKINFERNELQNIRNEYAQVLGRKFQDIIKKQNLYYKLLDKSLELYDNYNLMENKDEQK